MTVAQRRIHVAGARTSRLASWWQRLQARVSFVLQRGLHPLPSGKASLDLPLGEQVVLYNPLARDWNAYRARQVHDFLARLVELAAGAGLPRDKLYSHQILPQVNSSWNTDLFATEGTISPALPWKQGFNTYGGAAGGDWIRRFVQEGRLSDYGVPEFHPQQWKQPRAAVDALRLHQRLGARFVSPYYLSIASDRGLQSGAPVKAMEIRPNNKLEGSDMLFNAIREVASP